MGRQRKQARRQAVSSTENTFDRLSDGMITPVPGQRQANACRRLPLVITPSSSTSSPEEIVESVQPDNIEGQNNEQPSENDESITLTAAEFQRYQRAFNAQLWNYVTTNLSSINGGKVTQKRQPLPLKLTENVRAVYKEKELAALGGEEIQLWDFEKSFASPENEQVNHSISSGVSNTSKFSAALIRDAVRTHFKTKTRRYALKKEEKDSTYLQNQRKRSRLNTKRQQRIQALKESTSIENDEKLRLQPIMTNDFISSDDSMSDGDDVDDSGSSCSDSEDKQPIKKAKILLHRKLTWRSQDLDNVMKKLDRRILRKRSRRASSMVIGRREGQPSQRTAPIDAPDWAVRYLA